jgi:folate-binding Fe-S cluster repair protein YgfZ
LTAAATAGFRPERGGLFDLSARAKLRISGADRLRYLNGQISNDLRKATEITAIHACVLTAKGKINADVFITADADSFLVDSEAKMREALAARLERYVIADDVQIDDVTTRLRFFMSRARRRQLRRTERERHARSDSVARNGHLAADRAP